MLIKYLNSICSYFQQGLNCFSIFLLSSEMILTSILELLLFPPIFDYYLETPHSPTSSYNAKE